MTDLLYAEVEEELSSSVRTMLAEQSSVAQVLARCEQGEAYDPQVWQLLAGQMGLAGLAVAEEHGGAGASLREAAVVLEELGRGITPVPYLASAVIATVALRQLAGTTEAAGLLRELATGAATAALALPFATAPGQPEPTVRVMDGALSGHVRGVADLLGADTLLVPTDSGLYAAPGSAAGVERQPVVSLDLTRPLGDLVLDGAGGTLLADVEPGQQAVAGALIAGAALLASEQLGVAEWCLESTVAHVQSRYQFGRPVGSFQALKHRLADVWVEVAQARAVARYAALCVATEDPDAAVAAALAQAHCSRVAVHAAEECVQLHGGIGFTWEHPAHLFLKRAKADAVALGTPDRHRAALADLVDLPATPSTGRS